MTPAERGAVYASMNETIAALHGIDPAAVGLGDFGRPSHYLARQIARWTKQYRASKTTLIAAIMQGVMKNVLDGTTASREALDVGARARRLG